MNLKTLYLATVISASTMLFVPNIHAQVTVDSSLPKYESAVGVSGNLNSIGSDTLNNLMTLWVEGFCSFYPNVSLEPLRAEFIRYVYSQEGQNAVLRAEFFPLVGVIADQDLKKFDLR